MNKFKIGDLVKRIADPAFDYCYMVSGGVYTVTGLPEDGYDSIEVNDLSERWDYTGFELFQPHIEAQSTDDLQSELTEAYAKIDTLESALEDAVREIFSLKHQLIAKAANTCLGIERGESEFKPISEMTLEDWELAKEEGWVFEMNNGKEVFVKGIMEDYNDRIHPVEVGNLSTGYHEGTVTIQGYFYSGSPDHPDSIKCRIK